MEVHMKFVWKSFPSHWNTYETSMRRPCRRCGKCSLTFIMLIKHFSTFHAGNVIAIFEHLLCYRNTEDVLKEPLNNSTGSAVWNSCGKVFLNIGKLKKHQAVQLENVDNVL